MESMVKKRCRALIIQFLQEVDYCRSLGAMILGCLMVYGFLFGLGYWIYGELGLAAVYFSVGVISGWILKRMWGKLSFA